MLKNTQTSGEEKTGSCWTGMDLLQETCGRSRFENKYDFSSIIPRQDEEEILRKIVRNICSILADGSCEVLLPLE